MVMCQAVLRAQASHRVAWRKYPWDPLGAFREGIQGPTSRLQYIYICAFLHSRLSSCSSWYVMTGSMSWSLNSFSGVSCALDQSVF